MSPEKPKKILVAEDSDFLMRVYELKIHQFGYQIFAAKNGNEAMYLAQAHHPDLIILDNIMPGKTGIECLRELKKIPATKDIPVIILSNSEDDVLKQECISLGAVDFILKVNINIQTFCEDLGKYFK